MSQLEARSFTPSSLREHFESLARKKVLNKEDVILFNPCIFKVPEDGFGIKQDQNFLSASCLVLDFDNGSFSPEDFIRLFWDGTRRPQKTIFYDLQYVLKVLRRTQSVPGDYSVSTSGDV